MREGEKVAEVFTRHLGVYIGQRTAPMALTTFSKQALGVAPYEVNPADAAKLLDAMLPMLNVLLGKDKAEEVVKRIHDDLGSRT